MRSNAAIRPRVLLMTALALRTGCLLLAQDSGPPETGQKPAANSLMIKKTVRRVIVDVVVTDTDGKPVRGLGRDDFSVAEDGTVQRVLSFEAHDFNSASISIPPNLPPLPRNTFVNIPSAPERGPLYVILYDMVNMEVDDQVVARQQLLKFIRGKPPGTRFAIFVLSDGLRLVQGFTDDQNQLFAALDPGKPRAHVPRIFLYARNYGRNDSVRMVAVFTHIAEFLDGLPGRKNLIWLSGSFPLSLFPR